MSGRMHPLIDCIFLQALTYLEKMMDDRKRREEHKDGQGEPPAKPLR
jgi:hypothetical protein